MASPIRPYENINHALILGFQHASQPPFSKGQEVKFNGDDNLLQAAGANDPLAIGIIHSDNAAGREASVHMYGSSVAIVTVGTGDCTRGVDAITVADGFTDAAANGGGTSSQIIKGKFLHTGVAGDKVSLLIGVNQRSVKA